MDKRVKVIQKKVLDYIRKNQLIEAGDRILAAVSGGADSVCLLMILTDLKKLLQADLEVITVDHGIRGQSARDDVEYVKTLGKQLDIRVHAYKIDVPAYVREEGLSEEEAARALRYQCIREVCEKERICKTAIGHHMEDNAETILHNLFRGSGLRGLSGIQAKSEVQGTLIRPILCLTREEIEEYLRLREVEYRTDESNFSTDYTRNRIRHRLMPMIKEDINTQAISHIVQAGELIEEVSQLLEEMAESYLAEHVLWRKNDCLVKTEGMNSLKPIIRREIYYQIIAKLSGVGYCKDVTSSHLQAIDGLVAGQVSKYLTLPGKLQVKKTYDGLLFERISEERAGIDSTEDLENSLEADSTEKDFLIEGADETEEKARIRILCPGSRFRIEARLIPYHGEKIIENGYTKWLDYDKIKVGLLLRTRKSGDYITLENGGKKSLKSYLIDKKIPADERDRIPLLCEGNHVIWIGDGRLSSYYKVTEKTKRVLEWSLENSIHND